MLRTSAGKSVAQARQFLSPYKICSIGPRPPSRHLTTNAARKPSSLRTLALLSAASLISGFAGYFLANKPRAHEDTPMKPRYGSQEDYAQAINELKKAFAGDEDAVSTNSDDLYSHGFSVNDYHPGASHTVIIYPTSTEDVVKVVKISTKYRMPIIAYSGGTSLEGQFRGYQSGGICLDMSRMNNIIEIHEADSDLVCQPGACWSDINDALREKKIPLFFPLDPAPTATIGGMLSTGCSGTNAVRYGTGKAEWFLNATVVLPSGEVIKTRRRARKSSAGFDTTKLFIGAEGTLGIVTEVTIRLTPLLPTAVAIVHFSDVRKATEAVREVTLSGVTIQCVELLDDLCMHALNQYGQSAEKWPEKDTLLFKFQGHNKASLAESGRVVEKIVARHGGFGFKFAKDDQEAEDLWETRKNALYAGLALISGSRAWSTDVCVPVSKLPELVYETKKDLASSGLVAPMAGHVGDGNFHAALLISNEKELEIARDIVSRMVHRAIALDGTCTGEHGVGIGKKDYLVEELGSGTVELMKLLKRTIDPLNLFNPGKLYPDDDTSGEKARK
ncbi:FAD-linked oxidase-like protein [Lentinula raphanica]|nr:FAD-linked oxidase-like protein [Lentinula raphanica]KAJ3966026.1 FAD-linked oxidase-like protein [Lentinula raphanica]